MLQDILRVDMLRMSESGECWAFGNKVDKLVGRHEAAEVIALDLVTGNFRDNEVGEARTEIISRNGLII